MLANLLSRWPQNHPPPAGVISRGADARALAVSRLHSVHARLDALLDADAKRYLLERGLFLQAEDRPTKAFFQALAAVDAERRIPIEAARNPNGQIVTSPAKLCSSPIVCTMGVGGCCAGCRHAERGARAGLHVIA